MPRDLAADYDARRPLLVAVADAICSDLQDELSSSEFPATVRATVMSGHAFANLVRDGDVEETLSLVDVVDQITIEIRLPSTVTAPGVLDVAGTFLTVVTRSWSEIDSVPVLKATCLIPPQAKPPGFEGRNDVPQLFELRIHSEPNEQQTDADPRLVVASREPTAVIMKGGGIKGLAYVGAVDQLANRYEFDWYIGTSAGAIVAVLLGAGYSPDELKDILKEKNFAEFFDAPWWRTPFNLLFRKGLYRAEALTDWIDSLLAEKLQSHVRVKLSHLPHRVTIYASCRGKRALTFDSVDHDADAAYAVRCSMSIPFVFTPQSDQGLLAFDGGIQNNFPVDELRRQHPEAQFVGLFLGRDVYQPPKRRSVLSNLFSIVSEGGESEAVHEFRDQMVVIDPTPVETLDFSLTNKEKQFLLTAGKTAALRYLKSDSDALANAIAERDELREAVVSQRQQTARRTKRIWMIALAVAVLVITIGLWARSLISPA